MSLSKKDWMVLLGLMILIALPQITFRTQIARITNNISTHETIAEAGGSGNSTDTSLQKEIFALIEDLKTVTLMAMLFSAVSALLLIGVMLHRSKHFFRNIVVELDQLAGKIDGTSYAVKSAGTLLADDTRRQASAVDQISQIQKCIAASSRDNAQYAGSANQRMQSHVENIVSANRTLQRLISSMSEIKAASENIQIIVDTISNIASKTNLLAINAGVESVRAGEAGQTFGVIAGEVRNLALGATDSAKQTHAIAESAIEKTNSGAATAEQVVDVFHSTIAQVEEIKENMASISRAAQDQSEQFLSLENAIVELNNLTHRNVENAAHSDSISEELQKNGEALRVFLGNIISKTVSRRKLSDNNISRILKEIEGMVFRIQSCEMDKASHQRILSEWKSDRLREIGAIYTCRRDGSFIFSDPPAGILDARVRHWWQKAVIGRPYMSPTYISAINHKPCQTISVPFYTPDNRIGGVLGVDLKL